MKPPRQEEIERLARFMGWHNCAAGGFCDLEACSTGRGLKHLANDDVFNPFTCLDDAFMVAEKIAGGHRGCFNLSKDSDDDWWAKFEKPGEDRGWVNNETSHPQPWVGISGDSAPEAITLAALAYLDAMEKP